MKTCFKCKATLPVDDFYRDSRMVDGHLGKCKECTKSDVRANYALRLTARHEYERLRNQTPERKAALSRSQSRQRRTNPEKARARARVAYAVKSGVLARKPCASCGGADAQAHHSDYSMPLVVEWLCFVCHRKEHGQHPDPFCKSRHVVLDP